MTQNTKDWTGGTWFNWLGFYLLTGTLFSQSHYENLISYLLTKNPPVRKVGCRNEKEWTKTRGIRPRGRVKTEFVRKLNTPKAIFQNSSRKPHIFTRTFQRETHTYLSLPALQLPCFYGVSSIILPYKRFNWKNSILYMHTYLYSRFSL